jgi:hypothetical protein
VLAIVAGMVGGVGIAERVLLGPQFGNGFVNQFFGHVLNVEAVNVMNEDDVTVVAALDEVDDGAAGGLGRNYGLKAPLAEVFHYDVIRVAGWLGAGAMGCHLVSPR